MSKNPQQILQESRRLAGLSPMYEAAGEAYDFAKVASKEYTGAPVPQKDGVELKAGGGETSPSAGGSKAGPKQTTKTAAAKPAAKDGVELDQGNFSPDAKAVKAGGATGATAGAMANSAPAKPAAKDGVELKAGGDSKVAKAGGAVPGDANREDDGLEAEPDAKSEDVEVLYREARNARMYELVQMFSA